MEPADEIRDLAALYSLGVLDGEPARQFEQLLAEQPGAKAELDWFSQAAATLTLLALPQSPPPSLKEKLMQRIRQPAIPTGAAALVRAGEGSWAATGFAGVAVKLLFYDPMNGNTTILVRMEPKAVYPGHRHASYEHCYVLEGDLVFADHTLYGGDFEVACMGTSHSSVTTRNGCLLLVTNNERDEVLG